LSYFREKIQRFREKRETSCFTEKKTSSLVLEKSPSHVLERKKLFSCFRILSFYRGKKKSLLSSCSQVLKGTEVVFKKLRWIFVRELFGGRTYMYRIDMSRSVINWTLYLCFVSGKNQNSRKIAVFDKRWKNWNIRMLDQDRNTDRYT
jgi:hypothetical protein